MDGSRFAEGDASGAPRLAGTVEHEGRLVELALSPASRLTLGVEAGAAPLADGAVLPWLDLRHGGRQVRLGRCRFSAQGSPGAGRLVFLDDLPDLQALATGGEVSDLRGALGNLPLVIAQRQAIRPEFREHVAEVAYDLSVFKRFLDDQDALLAGEPEDAAAAARDVLRRGEGPRFFELVDAALARLAELVHGFGREEHERHGFFLRRVLWPYLMESAFLRRTNLKPRGYAGDAELMTMLYENAWVGDSLFGQLLHRHPCTVRAADAVRARRLLVPRILREVAAGAGDLGPRGLRVLSLAAGPARELEEVVRSAADAARLEVTLLDQDPFALDLARGTVARVEAAHGVRLAVRYLQDSVRTMLRSHDLAGVFGRQHFVYSMGLFDYLTAPVARAVLAKAYGLLEPGGTLVVGNFHVGTPTRLYMAYWADWPLWYRTEEEFLELADGLGAASVALDFDETRCQMFLRVVKPR